MGAKRKDLTGRTFGRLYVERYDEHDHRFVICRCECGNIKRVRTGSLTRKSQPVQSCGCIRREKTRELATKYGYNINDKCEMSRKYGTNFGIIERSNKPGKRNKSGRVGVWFNEKTGKYMAYIGINRKLKNLGSYEKIDDAIAAREEAEELYFAPLIAAKNAELGYAT